MNGQHDLGEIKDEEIKRYMMTVPIKMCQSEHCRWLEGFGTTQRLEKISFRNDQDFNPNTESISWMC